MPFLETVRMKYWRRKALCKPSAIACACTNVSMMLMMMMMCFSLCSCCLLLLTFLLRRRCRSSGSEITLQHFIRRINSRQIGESVTHYGNDTSQSRTHTVKWRKTWVGRNGRPIDFLRWFLYFHDLLCCFGAFPLRTGICIFHFVEFLFQYEIHRHIWFSVAFSGWTLSNKM